MSDQSVSKLYIAILGFLKAAEYDGLLIPPRYSKSTTWPDVTEPFRLDNQPIAEIIIWAAMCDLKRPVANEVYGSLKQCSESVVGALKLLEFRKLVKSGKCEVLPTCEFVRPLDGETVKIVLRDDGDCVVFAADSMIYLSSPDGSGHSFAVIDQTFKRGGQILMKRRPPGPQPAMRGYNITPEGLEVLDKFPGGVRTEGEGQSETQTSPEPPAGGPRQEECPVTPGNIDKPATILGKAKSILSDAERRTIAILVEAYPNGVGKDELEKGCASARVALKRLIDMDDDWRSVIAMPGQKGQGSGYRLVRRR